MPSYSRNTPVPPTLQASPPSEQTISDDLHWKKTLFISPGPAASGGDWTFMTNPLCLQSTRKAYPDMYSHESNRKDKHNRNHTSSTSVWTPDVINAMSSPVPLGLVAPKSPEPRVVPGAMSPPPHRPDSRYLPMMSRSAFSRASLAMLVTWET